MKKINRQMLKMVVASPHMEEKFKSLPECDCKELRDILSEALWYFSGNEDAQSLTLRIEKLGIKQM